MHFDFGDPLSSQSIILFTMVASSVDGFILTVVMNPDCIARDFFEETTNFIDPHPGNEKLSNTLSVAMRMRFFTSRSRLQA